MAAAALIRGSTFALAADPPTTPWPRPVPARLAPEQYDERFILTLGNVETALADGKYDPQTDRFTRDDGSVIEHYYRDLLGVTWFKPLDKSVFPLPPSGWCSWYSYYWEITPEELLANARWIAAHLREYGASVVQLDDGWQAAGNGMGDNRDWTIVNERFAVLGMERLAGEIRALGLMPGIWIVPHGQSNPDVARQTGVFLRDESGVSPSQTWAGDYLLDPTLPAAHEYLKELFQKLRGWGYTYFKIDGQPVALSEYASQLKHMKHPPASASQPAARAAELYRSTLTTIRSAIGPESYLLGCWGVPLPAIGIVDGCRTGGDITPGWDGFLTASDAVQKWAFLHNIAWYCDPDVVMVRPPLSDGAARCWATIMGLSGQALLCSDRLPDLPDSRVELLRRIYPATDIRPLDLFKPGQRKPLWLLKIAQPTRGRAGVQYIRPPERSYDVLGVFNLDPQSASSRLVQWSDLGHVPDETLHVYDFWSRTYLGAWRSGVFIDTPPADVRVLTFVPAGPTPALLSTSRHITQGWLDVADLEEAGGPDGPVVRGRSQVIANDAYTLTFGLPPADPSHRLAEFRLLEETASDGAARAVAPRVEIANHDGWATATIFSPTTREIRWEARFDPATPFSYPVEAPRRLSAQPTGLTQAELRWDEEYHNKHGYEISLNGQPIGIAFTNRASLSRLTPGEKVSISVRSAWRDDRMSEGACEIEYLHEAPSQVFLSALQPVRLEQGWGGLGRDRSVSSGPLTVGGQVAERGLGTHADSRIDYELYGAFTRFEARVGVDDHANAPASVSLMFEVWGDGRKLAATGPVASGDKPVPLTANIREVRQLELRVTHVGDSIDYGHADWLDARVTR